MEQGIYKFKNVKHSVEMRFVEELPDGTIRFENTQYKGLFYKATSDMVEMVRKGVNQDGKSKR